MRYIEIEDNKNLARNGFLKHSALDNPSDFSPLGTSDLIISGWVLSAYKSGELPDLYIDVDGTVSRIFLTIDRPDVVMSVFKTKNDVRLRCGFRIALAVKKRAEIYFLQNNDRIIWRTINIRSLSASKVLDKFLLPEANFAVFSGCGAATTREEGRSDNKWITASVRTFKGFEITVDKSESEKSHVNSRDLLDKYFRFGDFINVNFATSDYKYISVSGCVGDKDILKKEFIDLELPRDDHTILEKATDALMSSDMDLINLKKLIIRLRRAKRAKQSRLEFIGLNYDYAQQDLKKIREICTKFFPIIKDLIGIRYLWSIIDCFADFGTPAERGQALAISNFMHAESMMQSLHTMYDLHEKDNMIVDKQFGYWGGMFANRLLKDDSLDVFLTRAVEVLSDDALLYACFCEIILEAAYSKGSLIEENLRRSDHFKQAFKEYETVFRRHIATLHLTVPR